MAHGRHDRQGATAGLLLAAVSPCGQPGGAAPDLAGIRRLVRDCEQAGLHAVMLDDTGSANPGKFEVTTLAAALGHATERIGIVIRKRPDDLAPYHLARITASLDHLSRGRAGWWASSGTAEDVTDEYIEVVSGLWDSFDDDAFVHDRASGLYWRTDRMHRLDHVGTHYSVAGPLNVARPPQGHPVVAVQEDGPAWRADVVLLDTADPGAAAAARERLRLRAVSGGRDADHVKVIAPLPPGAGPAHMAAWLEQGAADGFLATLSGPDDPFLTTVVPQLRETGLLAAVPESCATLRERLGLPRPVGRFAADGA